MNWEKLKIFYYVAREKNISAAAKILGVTHSAISKKISSLEAEIGIKLLNRHVKGVDLTSSGKQLFPEIQQMFHKVNLICSDMNENDTKGHLKIFSDLGLVDTWLGKRLTKFIKNNMGLTIELKAKESAIDLSKGDYDIGLSTQVVESDYVQKKILMTWHRKLYASQNYIDEMGMPKSISCLNNHRLISFGEDKTFPDENMDWHLKIGCNDTIRRAFYTVNSMRALIDAAKEGLGIISFSEESDLIKNTNLVNILPDIIGPRINLYFVSFKDDMRTKAVDHFENFIFNEVNKFNEQ